jgi:plasmid maintenance system antidote protein VapI
MNKLKRLHLNSIESSKEELAFDLGTSVNEELASQKSEEITTNIAVKFAEFIKENYNFYFSLEKNCLLWKMDNSEEKYTSEELFEIFINQHY